jgi:uncharacterized protein (TIGR03000 family)
MKNRILLGLGAAGLALLLCADPALAQRRGGVGYRGGSYRGGAVYRGGAYRGGVYGGGRYYAGGWRGGYYGRNYGWGRGYWGWGYPYGLGLGSWGLGYPSYAAYGSYYPYYGSYYPYNGGYYNTTYSTYAPTYTYGYPDIGTYATGPTYVGNTTTTQSYYGPQRDPNSAQVEVVVPDANAQVLFDGTPTRQQGTNRIFVTPPLRSDKKSTYTITAKWTEKGQPVTREKRVAVRPGAQVMVNFTTDAGDDMPPASNGTNPDKLQTPQPANPNAQPATNPVPPNPGQTNPPSNPVPPDPGQANPPANPARPNPPDEPPR